MELNSFGYETAAGDTFDTLALAFYNDEYLAYHIIAANPAYGDVVVFGTGTRLTVPVIEKAAASSLPPWKRGMA